LGSLLTLGGVTAVMLGSKLKIGCILDEGCMVISSREGAELVHGMDEGEWEDLQERQKTIGLI
jgi:hypothetical protein